MAIEKEIRITGDTKDAQKEFNDLTKEIQEQKDITIELEKELLNLETQYKNTGKSLNLAGQKLHKKNVDNVKDAIKDQRIALRDLNNQRSKSSKLMKDNNISLRKGSLLVSELDNFTGGLASSFWDMGKAIKVGGKSMKGLLISSGIGILVVIVSEIVNHWEDITNYISGANEKLERQKQLAKDIEFSLSNRKGIEEKNLKYIKLETDTLLYQAKLRKASEKELFEIKQKGNNDYLIELRRNITRQESEMRKIAKVGGETYEKALLNLKRLQDKEFSAVVEKERFRREYELKGLEDKRKRSDKYIKDETARLKRLFDFENKLKTLNENLENKSSEDKIKLARKRAQLELNNLDASFEEKKKAQEELDIYYNQLTIDLETKKTDSLRKGLEDRDLLTKKFKAEDEENPLTKLELEREILDLEYEMLLEDYKRKKDLYEEGTEARIKADNEYKEGKLNNEDEITKNTKKQAKERKRTQEEVADAKKKIQDQNLDNASKAFGLLGKLDEDNKALQAVSIIGENAVGIGKQVINTKAANSAALLQAGGNPALAAPAITANNISLGLGVGASVLATTEALSALGKGGSASSSSGDSEEVSAPSFNIVEGTQQSQIAENIESQSTTPTRAYVVSTDITSEQQLNNRIQSSATL